MQAYAWSETGKDGRHRFFAVLGVPPIDSASSAVRGSIWADAQALRESIH
jgi:hypothetical protein